MRNNEWAGICAAAVLAASGFFATQAAAQTDQMDGYDLEDFALGSAGELVDVCTIEASHPEHLTAMAFCYGFFEGGYHYDQALMSSPDYHRLVCEPDGTTRTEAVEVFVTYVKANPHYAAEMPIDAIFRALTNKWPCT
jgi:hypothetical protein